MAKADGTIAATTWRDSFKRVSTPYGAVTAEPKPDPEALAQFYHDLYYQDEKTRSSTYQAEYTKDELAHKRLLADLLLYAINRHVPHREPETREFLDVGCGEGFQLVAAAEAGWLARGIDFSNYAIETFNPKYVDSVHVGDAYKLLAELPASGRRFDACVLVNVLEHVIDPAAMMRTLRDLLKPDGVVAITIPNDYSQLQETLLELGHIDRDFWFSPPQHLHYFNTVSGPRFAEQNGYETLDIYSGFPIDYFLFHPGANYVRDPKAGKAAHHARVAIDLLLAKTGMDKYYQLCRSMAACGVGRTFTMILRPVGHAETVGAVEPDER